MNVTMLDALYEARDAMKIWRSQKNSYTEHRAMEAIERAITLAQQERAIQRCGAVTCNNEITQRQSGRPKQYCSDACRKRAERKRRAAERAS